MPILNVVLPPRPPELPVVPPPATEVSPLLAKGPHLRNDAFLSKWVEDFERVIKDAWLALMKAILAIEDRILVLETRVADTYTWGQRGGLQEDTRLALPLRVVRPEKIVEITLAAEVASTSGAVLLHFKHNGLIVLDLALAPHETFAAFAFQLAMAKDDKLEVVTVDPGTNCEDVVVQARCV